MHPLTVEQDREMSVKYLPGELFSQSTKSVAYLLS